MTTPASIDTGIESNSDVRISPALAALFPNLEHILTSDLVLARFDDYDARARAAKKWYHRIGVVSIVCVFISLEWEVASLTWEAWGGKVYFWLNVMFGTVGVVALVLIGVSRVKRFRSKWLVNVFLRERIRQWRHKLLLDGELMDLGSTDRAAQLGAIENRWERFVQEELAVADGGFDSFVAGGLVIEGNETSFHPPSNPPDNAVVREEVLQLQEMLRLKYQVDYARSKTSPGGHSLGFSVGELTDTIDKAATTTLALAVALIVARLFVEIFTASTPTSTKALIILGASATALAVASAAIRALRNGLAIPGERDAYIEYGNRMQELSYRFQLQARKRWDILEEAERASVEELRRFLVDKLKSGFIVF